VHLWAYPDLNERERLRGELAKNEEWTKGYIPQIRSMLVAQENKILSPSSRSSRPPTRRPRLRAQDLPDARGRAGEWLGHFKASCPSREKYSKNVGVFQTEAGQLNEAVHLWAYNDLNDRAPCVARSCRIRSGRPSRQGHADPARDEVDHPEPVAALADEVARARRRGRSRGTVDPEARKVVEMGYAGSERLTMNMGPQHPSAHGVFRAILTLEGETVVGVDAVIGYLHRCHEKLGETLTYTQYPRIASKTDYVAAMTSELAYVRPPRSSGRSRCRSARSTCA
jgi:hypothetical protein